MRITGLDIGRSAIKIIELDFAFGHLELVNYSIEKVTEHLSTTPSSTTSSSDEDSKNPTRVVLTQGQIEALKRILESRTHLKSDRLIVNLPNSWAVTRIFHFPTKDKKTLQNSLAFELEDDIPFDLKDVVYDFSILHTENITSTVYSAAVLKSDLAQLISELQLLKLDPDMVTLENWATCQLLKKAMPSAYEGRPIGFVNIGATQTSIFMVVGHDPILAYTCPCGGNDITKSIALNYNLSFDEAEQAKIDGAFLVTQTHLNSPNPNITEEQKIFSNTIADAISPIIRSLKQVLVSYKSQNKMTPRAIFITGGSSLIPNLPLFLEEELQIPVFQFTYISKLIGPTLQLSESNESQLSLATALALSMVKIDKNTSINFRKDEFTKRGGLGTFQWNAYKKPIQYLSFTLTFIFLNFLVQGLILSSRLKNQEVQLERSIKSVLGAISPSVMQTYSSSPSLLKSAIEKELAKYKSTSVAPEKKTTSAFELLNKVSANMKKNITLDINLFQVKDGKVEMKGILTKITDTDVVAKALEETNLLTEITKGKIEEDPKTKKTKFEFSAKLAESSTGTNHVKTQ